MHDRGQEAPEGGRRGAAADTGEEVVCRLQPEAEDRHKLSKKEKRG